MNNQFPAFLIVRDCLRGALSFLFFNYRLQNSPPFSALGSLLLRDHPPLLHGVDLGKNFDNKLFGQRRIAFLDGDALSV